MKVLYFGSFNPVHNGHIKLTSYVSCLPEVSQVVVVPSPANPLKVEEVPLSEKVHMQMLSLAMEGIDNVVISPLDYRLAKPSYTIDALRSWRQHQGEEKCALLIGEDNLFTFPQWKEWELILEWTELWVYPRKGYKLQAMPSFSFRLLDAPLVPISSTAIRERITRGEKITHAVPENVIKWIEKHALYR